MQAAASSCLEAFLTAVSSVTDASEKNPPWLFFKHKSLSCVTGWSSLLCSCPSFSVVVDRGGKKTNRTSSVYSFPEAAGLPLQNHYFTLMAVASGIAITSYSVSSPDSQDRLL